MAPGHRLPPSQDPDPDPEPASKGAEAADRGERLTELTLQLIEQFPGVGRRRVIAAVDDARALAAWAAGDAPAVDDIAIVARGLLNAARGNTVD